MAAALAAGDTHRGHTWPNPAVGCVLADPRSGAVIATGCTLPGGRPHAETEALARAGDRARGAVAYVTLEPCAHASPQKPLSCTDALVAAGIGALVAALPDPDPRVAGSGFSRFRAANIPVHVGLCADAAFDAHRGHITRILLRRPFVTLKIAHSRDWRVALSGQRTAITGDASWQRVFALRGRVDAVLTGIGTVLADDPQLTDRRRGASAQPVRVILDTHARTPLAARLFDALPAAPLWIVCAEHADAAALAARGAVIIRGPLGADGRLDLPAVMGLLHARGLAHILVEGGAVLAAALAQSALVDEALVIEGPVTLGDGGVLCPDIPGLVHRGDETEGDDIWRLYDSAAACDLRRSFFSGFQTHPAG